MSKALFRVLSWAGVIRRQVHLPAEHPLTVAARAEGRNRARHRLYSLPLLGSDEAALESNEELRLAA